MPDIDSCFQGLAVSGSLFYHQPREVHIASFTAKNPFEPSRNWLISQPTPAGAQNRRRFVHALATLDSQAMVDGGWVLPMGDEDAFGDLAACYRALPTGRFQAVGESQSADASQPVTFRWCAYNGRTYLYAVNDAPFPVTARLHVEAAPGCRVEEITGTRKIEPLKPDAGSGLSWEVGLRPYDLVAVRFSGSSRPLLESAYRLAGIDRHGVGSGHPRSRCPGDGSAQSDSAGRAGESRFRGTRNRHGPRP